MEDAGAVLDGVIDGGGVEDVDGEDGDARLCFGMECEEMGRIGTREDCGVDCVVRVLFV